MPPPNPHFSELQLFREFNHVCEVLNGRANALGITLPPHPSWNQICKWIIEHKDECKPFQEFIELISSYRRTRTEMDALYTTYYVKRYKVLRTVRHNFIGHDTRCWDILQRVSACTATEIRLTSWACPYFTSDAKLKPGASLKRTASSPAFYPGLSVFEKTLFVMLCNRAIHKKNSALRSGSSGSTTVDKTAVRHFADVFRKSSDCFNRLGLILNIIYGAWTAFATNVGFPNLEQMVVPYLTLPEDALFFQLLPSRMSGFASTNSFQNLHSMNYPVHEEQETPMIAFSAPLNVDTALRSLAKDFMEDLETHCLDPSLFNLEDYTCFVSLSQFAQACSGDLQEGDRHEQPGYALLPKRFKSYEVHSLARVRQHAAESNRDPDRALDLLMNIPTVLELTNGRRNPIPVGELCLTAVSSEQTSAWKEETVTEKRCTQIARHPTATRTPSPTSATASTRHATTPMTGDNTTSSQEHCHPDCPCTSIIPRLAQALQHHCRVFCCDFEDLMDEQEDVRLPEMEDPRESCALILTDPPHEVVQSHGTGFSVHRADLCTEQQMHALVYFTVKSLRLGGSAVIFCSPLTFRTLCELFEETRVQGDGQEGSSVSVFHVSPVPHSFLTKPLPSQTQLVAEGGSYLELACHVVKLVDEKGNRFTGPLSSSCTPKLSHCIPSHLPSSECLMTHDPKGDHRGPLRTSQRPLQLLQELVLNFTVPGDIVCDPFAGTLSTAMACIKLDKPRQFIGSDVDEVCVDSSTGFLHRAFATEMLKRSAVFGSPKLSKASLQLFLDHSDTRFATGQRSEFQKPITHQTLPKHLLLMLVSTTANPVFASLQDKPLSDWPLVYRRSVADINVGSLLAMDAAFQQLFIAPSLIKHRNAGQGLFTSRQILMNTVIGHYYGLITFQEPGFKSFSSSNTCMETGLLHLSTERFQHYKLELQIAFGSTKTAYLIASPSCCFSKVNDFRYWPQDDEINAMKAGEMAPRAPNVSFRPMKVPCNTASALSKHTFVEVVALCNIVAGSELYARHAPISSI